MSAQLQRSTVFAYADGSKSQDVEVTVEGELRHGDKSEFEILATVRIEYQPHGNVTVHVEKGEARSLEVQVDS